MTEKKRKGSGTMGIGELLVREDLISAQQLQQAIEAQRNEGGSIEEHLVKLGFIEKQEIEKRLTAFIAKQYRIPVIDLRKLEIEPEIVKLIPREIAEKHMIIPVNRSGQALILAMADPSNICAIDDVKFLTDYNIEAVVASEEAIQEAIEKYYRKPTPGEKPAKEKSEATEQKKEEGATGISYGFISPTALTVVTPGENGSEPKQKTVEVKFLKNGTLSKKSSDALKEIIARGNFVIVPFRP